MMPGEWHDWHDFYMLVEGRTNTALASELLHNLQMALMPCRVMLHHIFTNDYNGCQRVSAAPCNMTAT